MVVLFGAAGEIRSRCYHTATRTAGGKRPAGAFFRFAHTLFESLIQKEKHHPVGWCFSGAAGEIRSQRCRAATRTAGDKRPTGAFFRFAHTRAESLIQKEKPPPCWVMAFSGAAGEIRTLGTLLAYTRFPVVLVMTASILLRIGALDSKNDYTKNHSKVKHKFEKCAIF